MILDLKNVDSIVVSMHVISDVVQSIDSARPSRRLVLANLHSFALSNITSESVYCLQMTPGIMLGGLQVEKHTQSRWKKGIQSQG
jgi:hypothetical protein